MHFQLIGLSEQMMWAIVACLRHYHWFHGCMEEQEHSINEDA